MMAIFALAAVAIAIILATAVFFSWLFRGATEDFLDGEAPTWHSMGWIWPGSWFKPRQRLIASRRNGRGRRH